MDLNKGANRSFVEMLDKTAETNPLLWLPCVTLLGAVLGTRRLVNDIGTVLSPVKKAEPEAKCYAVMSDKPAYVRALSAFLAASMMVTFTPGLNGIAVTNAFAEENSIETEAGDQENGGPENTETDGKDTAQETEFKTTASKKSKKDIKITLNCMLKGMTAGNAHASINKSYLDNSADVWLMSSDAARKDAEAVMMQLGANAAYYVCYPFEINIYDADSKELISSLDDGSASFEMPVPKIMSACADKIKVYHVVDGYPEFVESEISADEDGIQSVKFSASKFSTYIFVAPSPAKDNTSNENQNKVPVSEDSSIAPAANEDISSASVDENNNAPAENKEDTPSASLDESNNAPAENKDDTPSASVDESNNAPAASEDTPSAYAVEENNLPEAVSEDYYDDDYNSAGEDVSSAAGAHASSVPVETAAMPVNGGAVAPVGEAPEKLRLSSKKRRYRIIRKRRLDDLVFVF